MMSPGFRIAKKVIEFVACLICCLGKYFTDLEARRVFLTRQKWSREWSLLHNVFWDTKGDAFAWITYGGFTIITLLFGIGLCIDSKSRPTMVEKIFLFIGALMFFGVGGLVFASIDKIPGELIDNAIVLGCLSFFVAFLFLVDMSEPIEKLKRRTDATQTDTSSIDQHFTKSQSSTTLNSQANLMDKNDGKMIVNETQNVSSNPFIINDQNQPKNLDQQNSLNSRGGGDSAFAEDIVESHSLPSMQLPVFSKVKPTSMVVNHLESEPYRKILQKSNQPYTYTRYHDTALQQQHDPSFYDDFHNYQKQSYYQGPKVDQGKLVIRDFSQHQQQSSNINFPKPHEGEDDVESGALRVGYVHQVAKFWDNHASRIGSTKKSHQKEFKGGLNTSV